MHKNIYVKRVNKTLNKFPRSRKLFSDLNKASVKYALAAGSAQYIYTGGETLLDDIDIWVKRDNKNKLEMLLRHSWHRKESSRHTAENIIMGDIDIFTNLKRRLNNKTILDYIWSEQMEKRLLKVVLKELHVFTLDPADIVLMKMANPRDEKEFLDSKELLAFCDIKYLQRRMSECRVDNVWLERLRA